MSRKGIPNRLTSAVKDKVEQAFNSVNGKNNQGLKDLARDHPAIFYGMVSKLIPQQAAVDITHTVVDLNLAFDQANARIAQLESERLDMITVGSHDQTDILSGDKVLIRKGNSD